MPFRHFTCALFVCILLAVSCNNTFAQQRNVSLIPTTGFLENKGQIVDQNYIPNPKVLYLLHNGEAKLQLRTGGFSYEVLRYDKVRNEGKNMASTHSSERDGDIGTHSTRVRSHRVDVELIGSNPACRVERSGRSEEYWNYILPHAPPEGFTEIHKFQTVTYKNIYSHIDLVFEAGNDPADSESPRGNPKYSFVVHPGGDPRDIRMAITGQQGLRLHDGGLEMQTQYGTINEGLPFTYQSQDGELLQDLTGAEEVRCEAVLQGETLSFQVEEYDPMQTLIIDPSIAWCTYYGGSGLDRGYGIGLFPNGDMAITGRTGSGDYIATAGAFDTQYDGDDGYVAKFTPDLQLIWGTYYGGPGLDTGRDIDVDMNGDIVMAGITGTQGLGTNGVHQQSNGGSWDAFLVKLSSSGARLWSTYFGGSGTEWVGFGLTVNSANDIIVVGRTTSSSNIATPGAHSTSRGGGEDAYIATFTPTGGLRWATYFGGTENDYTLDAITDGSNNIYITGETHSPTGIATPGAFQATEGGGIDSYVAKFSSAGQRIWASYIGGSGNDAGFDVSHSNGFIYLTGDTYSQNNMATPGAHQTTLSGARDAFLCKFDVSGNRIWSTYFGGPSGHDRGNAMFAIGNKIFFTGTTESMSGIATTGALQSTHNGGGDVFFTEFDPSGVLLYGTYFGGDQQDIGYDIVFDPTQHIIVVGETSSAGLATPGVHQTILRGAADAFILKIAVDVEVDLTILAKPNRSLCLGDSVQLSGSASGGTPPYSYHWTPATGLSATNIANPIASPAVTTTYIVTVTDATNDVARDTVTVVVSPGPTVDAGPGTVLCAGGTATLQGSATGGTPPYSISWTPSAGLTAPGSFLTDAAPGTTTTYTLTVTDSNGCTGSDTVVVTIGNALSVDAGQDITICRGGSASIGRSTSGGTAPYFYTWTPIDGLSDPSALHTEASPTQTTTYILFVVDSNGCEGRDTVTVTVTDGITVNAGPNVTICYGQSATIGTLPTSGAPPFTISWTPAEGLSNPNVARPTASPVITTTYIMTVTDKNGCTGSDTVTVTVSPELIASAGPDKRYCIGGSATLEGSASGGIPPYTYSWLPGIALSSRSIAQPIANPTTTTQYILCVTDSAGCTACDTVLVNVGERLFVDAGRDRYLCNNNSVSLRANVSGGTSPFTFHWSPPEGLSATNTVAVSASPTQSTSYIVTVTDANGCSAVDTVTVFVNEPIQYDAGPDATLCGGDTAIIGRAAGFGNTPYTYQWSPPHGLGTPGSATTTAAPGTTTSYIVTVTDADGCIAYDTVTVRVFDGPAVDAENARIICAGDTTQLVAQIVGGTPPYSIAWTPEIALSDPTIANPLAWPPATTKYTVRVTDVNGCTDEDTVLVTVKSIPEVHISPGGTITLCEGDSVTLTASGGMYSYAWSNGDTTMSIVVRQGGTYRVRVTSADGCTAVSEDVTVNILPGLSPEIIGPIELCARDSIAYRVDPPDMNSYQWTVIGGTIIEGDGTSRIRVNWDPGTVSGILEVVVGYGPCFGRDTLEVTILEQLRPTISYDGRTVLCPGSSLRLDAEGGYTRYRWSTGDTTRSITVSRSGDYYVWVEDSLGCDGYSDTIRVTESHLPGVEISGRMVLCGSEPASLTASYGFISYYWSSGEQDRTVRVFTPGSYTVTAVDSNGCISEATVSVEQQSGLSPNIIGDSLLCTGSTGVLSVNEAYSRIVWSTGDTTQSITIHRSGTYHVQVMNSFGCIGSDTIVVKERPRIYATLSTPDVEAEPGDRVFLRLWVHVPDTVMLSQMQFTGRLSFESSVFHPLSHSYYDEGEMRFIEFTGTYSGGSGVLIEIEGTALLGRVDKSTLVLDAFAWDDGCIGKQYIGGALTILICEEGGKRLVTTQPPEVQISVNPNPFMQSTQFSVTVHRGTNIRLEVKDALGRTIATLMESFVEPGNYSAHFDAAGLPSGVYYYILQTDTQHHTGSMRSVK